MASNLRANPESLDYQSTVRTSQGEEGGGVGGTQTRKSEKKEKRSRQLLFRWAFFTVLASRTGGQFPGEKRTPPSLPSGPFRRGQRERRRQRSVSSACRGFCQKHLRSLVPENKSKHAGKRCEVQISAVTAMQTTHAASRIWRPGRGAERSTEGRMIGLPVCLLSLNKEIAPRPNR